MSDIKLNWKQKNRIDTWKIYANIGSLQIFLLFQIHRAIASESAVKCLVTSIRI